MVTPVSIPYEIWGSGDLGSKSRRAVMTLIAVVRFDNGMLSFFLA